MIKGHSWATLDEQSCDTFSVSIKPLGARSSPQCGFRIAVDKAREARNLSPQTICEFLSETQSEAIEAGRRVPEGLSGVRSQRHNGTHSAENTIPVSWPAGTGLGTVDDDNEMELNLLREDRAGTGENTLRLEPWVNQVITEPINATELAYQSHDTDSVDRGAADAVGNCCSTIQTIGVGTIIRVSPPCVRFVLSAQAVPGTLTYRSPKQAPCNSGGKRRQSGRSYHCEGCATVHRARRAWRLKIRPQTIAQLVRH